MRSSSRTIRLVSGTCLAHRAESRLAAPITDRFQQRVGFAANLLPPNDLAPGSFHPPDQPRLATDDAQNGQCPATKRVSEQLDQSFDLMPFALSDRLHDTCLEPTNRAVDLVPVDGMPVDRRARSRTGKRCRCDISASLLEVGWPSSLVREDHGEVSPLSREGISSVGDSPSIRSISERHLLAPRSYSRCLMGRSRERLSPPRWCARPGRQRGCHVPPMYPSG